MCISGEPSKHFAVRLLSILGQHLRRSDVCYISVDVEWRHDRYSSHKPDCPFLRAQHFQTSIWRRCKVTNGRNGLFLKTKRHSDFRPTYKYNPNSVWPIGPKYDVGHKAIYLLGILSSIFLFHIESLFGTGISKMLRLYIIQGVAIILSTWPSMTVVWAPCIVRL